MMSSNKFNSVNNLINNKYINMGTTNSVPSNNNSSPNNPNVTDVTNNYVKYSTNPAILGPGVWYDIHLESKNAKTEEQKKSFVHKMYLLAQSFPCLTCRKHIDDYIQSNPFEPLWNETTNTGEQIGMFKWSWLFHNVVNKRLNKPNISWDNALYIFSDASINSCAKDCTDDHTTPLQPQLTTIQPQPQPQVQFQSYQVQPQVSYAQPQIQSQVQPQNYVKYQNQRLQKNRSPVYKIVIPSPRRNNEYENDSDSIDYTKYKSRIKHHKSSKHKTSKHKYLSPPTRTDSIFVPDRYPLYVKNSSYQYNDQFESENGSGSEDESESESENESYEDMIKSPKCKNKYNVN